MLKSFEEGYKWLHDLTSRLEKEVAQREGLLEPGPRLEDDLGNILKGMLSAPAEERRAPTEGRATDNPTGDGGQEEEEAVTPELRAQVLMMLESQMREAQKELADVKLLAAAAKALLDALPRTADPLHDIVNLPSRKRPNTNHQGQEGEEAREGGHGGEGRARKAPLPSAKRAAKMAAKKSLSQLCRNQGMQLPNYSAGLRESARFLFQPQNKQLDSVAIVNSTSLMHWLEQDGGLNKSWISREYLSVCMSVEKRLLRKNCFMIKKCGRDNVTDRLFYRLGFRPPAKAPPRVGATSQGTAGDPPSAKRRAQQVDGNRGLLFPPSPKPLVPSSTSSALLSPLSGYGSVHHDLGTPSERRHTRSFTRSERYLSSPPATQDCGIPSTKERLPRSPATVQGKGPSGEPAKKRGRPWEMPPPEEGKEGWEPFYVDANQLMGSINHAEFPTKEDTPRMHRVACHTGGCQGKRKVCANISHVHFQTKRKDAVQKGDYADSRGRASGHSQKPTFTTNVTSHLGPQVSDANSENGRERRKSPRRKVAGPRRPLKNERFKVRDQDHFDRKNAARGNSFLHLMHLTKGLDGNTALPGCNWTEEDWGASAIGEVIGLNGNPGEPHASPPPLPDSPDDMLLDSAKGGEPTAPPSPHPRPRSGKRKTTKVGCALGLITIRTRFVCMIGCKICALHI